MNLDESAAEMAGCWHRRRRRRRRDKLSCFRISDDQIQQLYRNSIRLILNAASIAAGVEIDGRRGRKPASRARRVALLTTNVVYCYCIAKLLAAAWLNYKHDYLVFNYRKQLVRNSNSTANEAGWLLEAIQEARSRAKLFGSPLIQFPFVSGMLYMGVVVAALITKIPMSLYYRYVRHFQSNLISTLAGDEGRGQRWSEQMIQQEVRRFAQSAELFSRIRLNNGKTSSLHHQHHLNLMDDHKLERLQLSGALEPANRQAQGLYRLCRIFAVLCLYLALITMVVVGIFVFKPSISTNQLELTTWPDRLLVLDLTLLFIIGSAAYFFNSSTMYLCVLDQTASVKSMTREIEAFRWKHFRCVSTFTTRFEISHNFTLLYLRYRVFVRQTKQVRPQLGMLMLQTIGGGVLSPVLLHIHAPYLNPRLVPVIALLCLVMLFYMTLFMVPLCHFHSRCRDLYRSLHSLMAYLLRDHYLILRSHRNKTMALTTWTYDRHTCQLWLLELRYSDLMLDQLAPKPMGIPLTYKTYLKYAFWYCLMLLAINYMLRFDGAESRTAIFAFI